MASCVPVACHNDTWAASRHMGGSWLVDPVTLQDAYPAIQANKVKQA